MKYWIGVACREHVQRGIAGGFCQLCHGKSQPLERMAVGDWLIYYSSRETFGGEEPCQKFTAIGQVLGAAVYTHEMAPGIVPHRRDIRFLTAHEVAIRPLIEQLTFIKKKTSWGYAFRYGHLEIPQADFALIATAMLGIDPSEAACPAGRAKNLSRSDLQLSAV
jgi:hypothetical protein